MPPTQPTSLNWPAIGIIVVAVINISGWFVVHFLTKRREIQRDREARERAATSAKEGRKHTFRGFLVQFRSEAADRPHPPGTFAEFYQNKIPNLKHAAATLADDFTGERRTEFERLVSTAAGFTGAQADHHTGKKQITEAIDAIIRFIET